MTKRAWCKSAHDTALRGVTLVEVLIVVAIMAVIAGGAAIMLFPKLDKARIDAAIMGAGVIKKAAEMHMNLGGGDSDKCPTIQELVSSKQIDGTKTDDPWGRPYIIKCNEGDVHVTSSGKDRKEGTPDDVRDDMKDSDVKKLM